MLPTFAENLSKIASVDLSIEDITFLEEKKTTITFFHRSERIPLRPTISRRKLRHLHNQSESYLLLRTGWGDVYAQGTNTYVFIATGRGAVDTSGLYLHCYVDDCSSQIIITNFNPTHIL